MLDNATSYWSFYWLDLLRLMTIPVLLVTHPTMAQVSEQLHDEIEKIIRYETEISFDEVPGFCLGIVDGDSTYIYSFGSTGPGSNHSISDSAIFELGGLTKVFTALLFNELESRGLINRHVPINNMLYPEERNPVLPEITSAHLLDHTSGLGALPTNLGSIEKDLHNRYASYGKNDLLQYYHSLKKTPGNLGKYIYSHVNYALLEVLMERAAGAPFALLLDKYLFHPLDLYETGIVLSEKHRDQFTKGHTRSSREATPWLFNSFAGSEGLKSSPRDLCQVMQLLLSGKHPLSKSFENSLILHKKIRNTKKTHVADGWHAFKNKKHPNIYLHTGKTDGHGASISFVGETRTAVILMTNAIAKMDGLALLVLRLINDNWKRKTN